MQEGNEDSVGKCKPALEGETINPERSQGLHSGWVLGDGRSVMFPPGVGEKPHEKKSGCFT